jgi:hypothetical protein
VTVKKTYPEQGSPELGFKDKKFYLLLFSERVTELCESSRRRGRRTRPPLLSNAVDSGKRVAGVFVRRGEPAAELQINWVDHHLEKKCLSMGNNNIVNALANKRNLRKFFIILKSPAKDTLKVAKILLL